MMVAASVRQEAFAEGVLMDTDSTDFLVLDVLKSAVNNVMETFLFVNLAKREMDIMKQAHIA
jgi:hypothetical protein